MDDTQLTQHAQAGDHRAFSALVGRHQQQVYRLCCRMTGNAETAEELAHEAFIEAFVKLAQLRDPGRFLPWVRTIALNLYRMSLRGSSPMPAELTEDIAAQREEDDGLDVRVVQGLSHLSYPHRLALVLHYLEGLSYEEIATFLDVPIGTVMSRLHRGRKELKRLVQQAADEEIPMTHDEERFTQEIDAEIAVLLEMFKQEASAPERLSVILGRAPERFAQLVADASDEETLGYLAMLLRRLGRPAIEVALNCALSAEASVADRATRLLVQFMAHLRENARGGTALSNTAPFEAYLLLDGLVRSTADEGRKADLLVALLAASEDAPVTALLTNVLLGYADAALPGLLARFRQAAPEEGNVPVPVLSALARMGTRFAAELLAPLASGDTQQQVLALTGMEGFARSLHSRWLEPEAHALRFAAKWAPIPAELVDPEVVAEAVRRVAALLDDSRAEVRDRAVRVLGQLKAGEYQVQLAQLTRHQAASTRLAALRALAEIGGAENVPAFTQAAAHGTPAERVAAVEALGRMQAVEAEPVLLARVHDEDKQVRRAAVVALGDIGGDAVREVLQQLMRGGDKEVARTAARVLHTSPHFRRRAQPNVALQELHREVRTRMLGEEAKPCAFISLHAAIAALPENRPYEERELTRLIARACIDYSTTRRQLIMDRLMRREGGIYELTDTGEAVWRVERFIHERYLR